MSPPGDAEAEKTAAAKEIRKLLNALGEDPKPGDVFSCVKKMREVRWSLRHTEARNFAELYEIKVLTALLQGMEQEDAKKIYQAHLMEELALRLDRFVKNWVVPPRPIQGEEKAYCALEAKEIFAFIDRYPSTRNPDSQAAITSILEWLNLNIGVKL